MEPIANESYHREGMSDMQQWECLACGYIYDPAAGDPEAGVPAGTSFDDLPDDWICPECGADKSMFEAL